MNEVITGDALTFGSAAARRGAIACRPSHEDWPQHNLAEIARFIAANPYIRTELGDHAVVSVHRSADGRSLAFSVRKREVQDEQS